MDYFINNNLTFVNHLLVKHFLLQQPTTTPTIQITGIVKNELTNPYEKIVFLWGLNTEGYAIKFTQAEVIRLIEHKGVEFYILQNNNYLKLEVAVSKFWIKYLKVVTDKDEPEALLALPNDPL